MRGVAGSAAGSDGAAAAGSAAGRLGRRLGGAFGGGLLAGFLGALEQMFGDLGHDDPCRHHNGPLIPPSLRTRQKWIAMKITVMNGKKSTCSTYHRSNVSGPISAPPSKTKRTS